MTLTLSPTENETATEEVVKLDPQAQQNRVRVEKSLLPVEIKRDEEGGNITWESMTGKMGKALPGQRINLKLEVPGLPSGMKPTAIKWTVKGKTFSNYVAYDAGGNTSATKDEIGDLVGEEISLFWSEPGSHEIKVEFSLSGQDCTHTQTIELKKPNGRLRGNIGLGVIDFESPTSNDLVFGGMGTTRGVPGIVLPGGVTSLKPEFTEEGKYQYVQLLNARETVTFTDHSTWQNGQYNQWVLDTGYPYSAVRDGKIIHDSDELSEAEDSPMNGLGSYPASVIEVHNTDDFLMYLMFQPPGENTRWVPLKRVHWYWSWTATKSASGRWNREITQKRSNAEDSVDIVDHPIWGSKWSPSSR